MTRLNHDIRYDDTTLDEVRSMISSEDFRVAVSRYQQYTEREVTITRDGDRMTVVVDQRRPASEAPAFARKFVGQDINIVQEERWSSPTEATLDVSIPGKPGTMTGSVRAEEVGGGVTLHVQLDLKVNIPLIGGKIESFISGMLLRAMKAENKVGVRWLAGERGPALWAR